MKNPTNIPISLSEAIKNECDYQIFKNDKLQPLEIKQKELEARNKHLEELIVDAINDMKDNEDWTEQAKKLLRNNN